MLTVLQKLENMTEICTNPDDELILERLDRETRWVAVLSNSLTVYQDDNRYGESDAAWIRLKNYCQTNKVTIEKLRIQFRTNIQEFTSADGFYFTKGVAGELFNGGQNSYNYFVIGLVKNGEVHKTWYKIPEIISDRTMVQTVAEIKEGPFSSCLILNEDYQ